MYMLYNRSNQGLFTAACVFNWLSLAWICWLTLTTSWIYVIALAWMIPMCIHANRIRSGNAPNTIAFGVCTLIFVSFIGGILQLCAPKDEVFR